MKLMMMIVSAIAALGALLALIGTILPREHIATRSVTLRQSPENLFAAARDFAALPTWRSEVKSIELLPAQNGFASYRELTRDGAVTYRVKEERAGERLVLEIADENLPYGGTWTFAFTPNGSATSIRITEHGFVKPALFRFFARFVFGYTATIDRYLRALGKKFSEDVTPR